MITDYNERLPLQGYEPEPAYSVGDNLFLHDPDDIYPRKLADNCNQAYMIFLFLQYLCFFAGLPFDNIQNRPDLCVVADFLLICTVIWCIILLPINVSAIPHKQSFHSNLASLMLQFVCFVVQTVLTVLVLRSNKPFDLKMHFENKEVRSYDMKMFTQITSSVTLAITFMAVLLSGTSTWVHGIGLFRLLNRISRPRQAKRSHDPESMLTRPAALSNVVPGYRGQIHTTDYSQDILSYPPEVILALASRTFV